MMRRKPGACRDARASRSRALGPPGHCSKATCSIKACSIDGTKCSVVTPCWADRLDQPRRIAVRARRRHHKPRPHHQRPEELPHRDVKAERRLLQHHVVAGQPIGVLHPGQTVVQTRVRVGRALGLTGRARGVDHVGQMIGMQIVQQRRSAHRSSPLRRRTPPGRAGCGAHPAAAAAPPQARPASAPRASPASDTMSVSRSAGYSGSSGR